MRPMRALVAVAFFLLLIPLPSSTCEWDYPIWIPRSASADTLYRFTNGNKAGYIDQTGKIVIEATLPHWGGNFGGEFHDGLLQISGSDGIYVDRGGVKVIDKALHQGWDFSDGLAAALKTSDGKWGYINTKGEFVISPRFDSSRSSYVTSFENGFAAIEVNGKYGYIDHSGEFVIPPRFLLGDSFHDGMARVIADGPCFYKDERPCSSPMTLPHGSNSTESTPECKFTFIDTSGRILSQERFNAAGSFAEGLAPVRFGKHWGYIDKSGNLAIPSKFDAAGPFSDGLAAVSEDEQFGYIDHSGSFVIAPQFASAEGFADQRAVVGDADEYWYIDTHGKQAFPERFDAASPFFKGLAHVELIPKDPSLKVGEARTQRVFAYINPSGTHVFTYKP
jgi:hypothetical protein